jgi:hypothetical protein
VLLQVLVDGAAAEQHLQDRGFLWGECVLW